MAFASPFREGINDQVLHVVGCDDISIEDGESTGGELKERSAVAIINLDLSKDDITDKNNSSSAVIIISDFFLAISAIMTTCSLSWARDS